MIFEPTFLDDARDIVEIEKFEGDYLVYAFKPGRRTMKQLYEEASRHIPQLKFDSRRGIITGLDFFSAVRFEEIALRPRELWTPDMFEIKQVKTKSSLYPDLCREYGLGIGIIQNGCELESLVDQAKYLGFKPPIIIPLRDLTFRQEDISLVDDPSGVIDGDEAKSLSNINISSGITRLVGFNGENNVGWRELGNRLGGIDWLCGITLKQDILKAYVKLVERRYAHMVRKYEKRMSELINS